VDERNKMKIYIIAMDITIKNKLDKYWVKNFEKIPFIDYSQIYHKKGK